MKKYIPHISATALLMFLWSIANIVSAETVAAQQYVPLVTIPGVTEAGKGVDMTSYISNMIKFLIAASGALAIIILVIAGTKYIASGIAPDAKNDAKEQMQHAFIGLGLILTSYLILNTINPNLVNFKLSLESAVGSLPKPVPEVILPTDYPDDTGERDQLASGGVRVYNGSCTYIGQKHCTSIHGLHPDVFTKIINLKHSCGISCVIQITGGTEYWLHGNRSTDMAQNKTTKHKPYPDGGSMSGQVLDISKGSTGLNNYITTNGTSLGYLTAPCAKGVQYTLDGVRYVDEMIENNPAHWHVCYYPLP